MRIVLQTIPHDAMRYSTAGDWYWKNGELIVECPEHGENLDSAFLLLLHELVEAWLCHRKGIAEEDVSGWDLAHPDLCEPAEGRGSPYRAEHEVAIIVEKIVCAARGIVWEDHNDWVASAADEVDRKHAIAGDFGDWRPAAAVLFERESLLRNPAPSRAKGQRVASDAKSSVETSGILWSGGVQANAERVIDKAGTLTCSNDQRGGYICPTGCPPVSGTLDRGIPGRGAGNAVGYTDHLIPEQIAPTITQGPPFSRTGNQRVECEAGVPSFHEQRQNSVTQIVQSVAFEPGIAAREGGHHYEEVSGTLRADAGDNQMAVAVDAYNQTMNSKTSQTLKSSATDINHTGGVINPAVKMAVRRLTPTECERLQGFPDGYTAIPWRKKLASECPDGPRYKALGISMAVPVMRWIGERIALFKSLDLPK
jgi:hypothetical protein